MLLSTIFSRKLQRFELIHLLLMLLISVLGLPGLGMKITLDALHALDALVFPDIVVGRKVGIPSSADS